MILRFCDFVQREALVRKKLIANDMGADDNAYQAPIRNCGIGPVLHDDLHLLASSLETSTNS